MNAILEIIQRWQDPGPWATVKALATQAAEFDSQAVKLGGDARFLLDRGDIEQACQLKAEADHLRKCAAIDSELLKKLTGEECAASVREQRSELASEFMQIENWVREHRPELLEFVPMATFEGEHTEAVRDLKRLEARLREKNANCGAPLFKKDPPFGPRVSIEVQNAVNTFMAEWNPTLNKDQWCDEYRKRVKRPDWKLRKILYDYLTFHDS